MISRYFSILTLALIFISCSSNKEKPSGKAIPEGNWRGIINTQGKEIPFNFRTAQKEDNTLHISLLNAGEEITITDTHRKGDSLIIPMHIFDTEIRAVAENGTMRGTWIKNYAGNYKLPFTATLDEDRFPQPSEKAESNLSGKWAISFQNRQTYPEHQHNAIGLFKQDGNHLSGTFLTPTGDYRYLEGVINNKFFTLSSFDGENAYLFEGEILHENSISGTFWSGKSRKESWTGKRDDNAQLPDPESLTFLKEGYDEFNFKFPDLNGNFTSLSDPEYQNKVIIVQVLGTWCPNCMDETRFLGGWYRRNKDREVAIIGLAYEKKDDFDYARGRIQKMAQKLDADYDFLIAGTPDKESTSRSLPMLNHVMSFPTTIFIDKQGKVRKIHTGFYGPGTGEYYQQFTEEFNSFTEKLLAE